MWTGAMDEAKEVSGVRADAAGAAGTAGAVGGGGERGVEGFVVKTEKQPRWEMGDEQGIADGAVASNERPSELHGAGVGARAACVCVFYICFRDFFCFVSPIESPVHIRGIPWYVAPVPDQHERGRAY